MDKIAQALVVLILFAMLYMFAVSDNATKALLIEHLKNGDAPTNAIHNTRGACSICGKPRDLTDGICATCRWPAKPKKGK